jgi:hypothetical protein
MVDVGTDESIFVSHLCVSVSLCGIREARRPFSDGWRASWWRPVTRARHSPGYQYPRRDLNAGHRLRRPVLYPAELRGPLYFTYTTLCPFAQVACVPADCSFRQSVVYLNSLQKLTAEAPRAQSSTSA